MSDTAADLRLETNRLTFLKIESSAPYTDGQITLLTPNMTVSSVVFKSTHKIKVDIKYSTGAKIGEKQLFTLETNYEGLFSYIPILDKVKLDAFAKGNAPAIIFPLLRSAISMATLGAGFPPLILPVVNFHKVQVSVTEQE